MLVALLVVIMLGATALFWVRRNDTTPAFENVSAIARHINENGVECSDFKILEEQHPTLKEFGLCYLDDGKHEADIYLFDSAGDAVAWLDQLTQLVDEGILVGPNWLITAGTDANAHELQDALGGRIAD